jgi:hypothetical protein
MDKNYMVLRKRLLGVEVCYNPGGEVLMSGRSASSLQKKLIECFPRDTYLVFKEVRTNAKKGISFIKNPRTTNS